MLLFAFLDAQGRRLEADRGGVVTRYVYDLSGNLLAETDGTDAVLRYCVYGLGLRAMVDASCTCGPGTTIERGRSPFSPFSIVRRARAR